MYIHIFLYLYLDIYIYIYIYIRNGRRDRKASRRRGALPNEQALVHLSNREIVDASRGRTFDCKMANNRFIAFFSLLVLA